jgi:hypothetical protein
MVATAAEQPVPQTVEALLHYVEALYEDQHKRGEALDARLATLTAFAGLLLTLIAPLGASHLGRGHGLAFQLGYIASVLIFGITALLAVSSTFRTRQS